MVTLFSERRMIENEVAFRQHNELIEKKVEEMNEIATEEDQRSIDIDENLQLHFYCECADENCRKRIIIKLSEYRKIHKKRDQFIIIPGHEVTSIERIVRVQPTYIIVQKLLDPPELAKKLNVTDVDNS